MSWLVLTLVFFLFLVVLLFPAQLDGSQAGSGLPTVGVNASRERCALARNEAQGVIQHTEFTQYTWLTCSSLAKTHPASLGLHIPTVDCHLSSNVIK